jgi:hypothetical protein
MYTVPTVRRRSRQNPVDGGLAFVMATTAWRAVSPHSLLAGGKHPQGFQALGRERLSQEWTRLH